jgi:hypothetical protein
VAFGQKKEVTLSANISLYFSADFLRRRHVLPEMLIGEFCVNVCLTTGKKNPPGPGTRGCTFGRTLGNFGKFSRL